MPVSSLLRLSVRHLFRFLCLKGSVCLNSKGVWLGKLLCRFLVLGQFLFLTGAGVCAWKVLDSSMVQVSMPGRFFVPHLCRCLRLGDFLILICAGFCAREVFWSSLVQVSVPGRLSVQDRCRCLCLEGYLILTWESLCV